MQTRWESVEGPSYGCMKCGAEVLERQPDSACLAPCPRCGSKGPDLKTSLAPTEWTCSMDGEVVPPPGEPESAVPFLLSREAALSRFWERFEGRGILLPGELTRERPAVVAEPIHVPFWAGTADVDVRYEGRRRAQVLVDYDDASGSRQSDVVAQHWHDVRGVFRFHSEPLVLPAFHEEAARFAALGPWDLDGADRMPVAPTASVPGAPANDDVARSVLEGLRVPLVEAIDAHGQCVPRVLRAEMRVVGSTLRPVRLPVWVVSFTYRGVVRRCLINGRTGNSMPDWPPKLDGKAIGRFLVRAVYVFAGLTAVLAALVAAMIGWMLWEAHG